MSAVTCLPEKKKKHAIIPAAGKWYLRTGVMCLWPHEFKFAKPKPQKFSKVSPQLSNEHADFFFRTWCKWSGLSACRTRPAFWRHAASHAAAWYAHTILSTFRTKPAFWWHAAQPLLRNLPQEGICASAGWGSAARPRRCAVAAADFAAAALFALALDFAFPLALALGHASAFALAFAFAFALARCEALLGFALGSFGSRPRRVGRRDRFIDGVCRAPSRPYIVGGRVL